MRKKSIYTAFRDPIYFPFNIDHFRELLNFIKLTTQWERLFFLFSIPPFTVFSYNSNDTYQESNQSTFLPTTSNTFSLYRVIKSSSSYKFPFA